jgi:hypothetical protein
MPETPPQYSPVVGSEQQYSLAPRSAKNVRALRELQVKTSFYSDRERYELMKEMLWTDRYEEKERETEEGTEIATFEIDDPELSSLDFLDRVAELLFPRAEFEADMSNVDYEVIQEALADFTRRFERQSGGLAG